jgi:hypothetical protein
LLTLKYLGSNAPFLRELAQDYAKSLPDSAALLSVTTAPKARRGRPKKRE